MDHKNTFTKSFQTKYTKFHINYGPKSSIYADFHLFITSMTDTVNSGEFSNNIGFYLEGSEPLWQSVLVIRKIPYNHHSHNTENVALWNSCQHLSS